LALHQILGPSIDAAQHLQTDGAEGDQQDGGGEEGDEQLGLNGRGDPGD